MTRLTTLLAVVIVAAFAFSGCSNTTNPSAPDLTTIRENSSSGAALWAYYDLYIDPEAQTMEAVLNRDVMLTVNVVNILNKNPAALGFAFNGTNMGPGYLDVDLDLSITHPFGGNPGLNGYDVRGILCADGTQALTTNPDLIYPGLTGSQIILNADGYTRWFNPTEFTHAGLFGYTPGIAQSKNFIGTCTLNPYKYFASGILSGDETYDFLVANSDSSGTMASGATVTRSYEIRFALPTPGIQYGYAIMASWISTDPADHPANTSETIAFDTDVTPSLYYEDAGSNGGSLILDISLFGWDAQPEQIHIESTVLSSAYSLTAAEMTPTDSDEFRATYHVEIPADNITGLDNQEFWVIAEHTSLDYVTPVPNTAGSDHVLACQRYDLEISDIEPNVPPVINSGVHGNPYPCLGVEPDFYNVNAEDANGDDLTYVWTIKRSGTSIEVYSGPGNGDGSIEVKWETELGALVDEVYDVDCTVSDSINPPVSATTLVVTIYAPPNFPPEVFAGVLGNENPAADAVEVYTITAVDPEGDSLNYYWNITNFSGGTAFEGPGDNAGTLTLDWANDVGAASGETYFVDCEVTDSINDPAHAKSLMVIIL